MACVCRSLAACQRHTPSSLAAVIDLSNNDVISFVPYVSSVTFHVVCVALDGTRALVLHR